MSRPVFDPKELIPVGSYPPASHRGLAGAPKYDRPVTPRENLKLYFSGKKPYWLPYVGMASIDVLNFRPRIHPDNVATHLVIDGEGPMVYEQNPAIGWFGLEWVFVPQVGGATVKPGKPAVTDICDWRNRITMPDLDAMDWEGASERNKTILSTDQAHEVCMLTGLWERLISLMDVDNAAVALIDEDQQEGVHDFFSALCDLYDELIDRYAKYFDLDMVVMHDDWGTQRAPFFSLDTCREMIVPYLKRVVNACHRNGLIFELHCCGMNETLVPAMIEAGVDLWCGQTINDFEKLSAQYPDTCLSFGVTLPPLGENATDAEIAAAAQHYFDIYKDRRAVFTGLEPRMRDAMYRLSRLYYTED